ncbi:anti-adapter protein IraP [Mixta sp. Marseille-Q2659]|uniref:anti-adapter protein IraP n=1 Tax=Mixta sp. Marseille-Q2659 TaxID=2736607 RepID=UPI0023BA1D07|nr:anti-adapter protein IraP [Mixta sp. Marseille-Q2659]
MKHLVIDILMKLAKMDVEAKEITAQVEAQSLLLAALLLTAGKEGSDSIEKNINHAILAATQATPDVVQSDIDLLLTHINRLLAVTRYVDEMTIAQGNKE